MSQVFRSGWIMIFLLSFIAISCDKKSGPIVTKSFTNTGFNWVNAGDDFEVDIQYANDYSITAKGEAADLEDLRLTQTGQQLQITYVKFKPRRSKVHFDVRMPAIAKLNLDGAAYGQMNGFTDNANLQLVLNGSSQFTLNNSRSVLTAYLAGTSKLNVTRPQTELIALVSGQSILDTYSVADLPYVDVSTTGQSRAYVNVAGSLFADASGQSRIYYKGNPGQLTVVESGEGKVVHQ